MLNSEYSKKANKVYSVGEKVSPKEFFLFLTLHVKHCRFAITCKKISYVKICMKTPAKVL